MFRQPTLNQVFSNDFPVVNGRVWWEMIWTEFVTFPGDTTQSSDGQGRVPEESPARDPVPRSASGMRIESRQDLSPMTDGSSERGLSVVMIAKSACEAAVHLTRPFRLIPVASRSEAADDATDRQCLKV